MFTIALAEDPLRKGLALPIIKQKRNIPMKPISSYKILILSFVLMLSCMSLLNKVVAQSKPTINSQTEVIKHFRVGTPFTLQDIINIDTKPANLSFSKYEFTIIDFWNSTCPPCIAEMKQFASLLYGKESKIQIISISVNQYWLWQSLLNKPKGIFEFLSQRVINWQQLSLRTSQDPRLKNTFSTDRIKELESQYKIYSYPTYFVVNNKGIIVDRPISAVKYIEKFNKQKH